MLKVSLKRLNLILLYERGLCSLFILDTGLWTNKHMAAKAALSHSQEGGYWAHDAEELRRSERQQTNGFGEIIGISYGK